MTFDITFAVVFRNEERHLPSTLASLAAQELNGYRAEVLLLDGMSTDRSRTVAEEFAGAHSNASVEFRVLPNPRVTAAAGFNEGIANGRGEIVGFGGAHAHYPPDYLRNAIIVMKESGADVVGGGHTGFVADRPGVVRKAMAWLYQSPMGSGVAAYHRRKTPGFVDTVFGGFYKREVFERIGIFNEALPRNQDNELNARVTSNGFRIYFDPRLSTEYVIKTDWKTFLKRAIMFGLNHPRTWAVNPKSFRLRHVIPAMFALYLLLLVAVLLATRSPLAVLAAFPLALYVVLLFAAGLYIARKEGLAVGIATMPVFSSYHLAYGFGTLAGIVAAAWRGICRA